MPEGQPGSKKRPAAKRKLKDTLRFYAQWGVVSPKIDEMIMNDSGDLARRMLATK